MHITSAGNHTHTGQMYVFMFPCTSSCQGLAQDILSDLVEDACLGLCFEVHRAVKQGYFFLDDTDQESMRDFGEHRNVYLTRFDVRFGLIEFIITACNLKLQKLWTSQDWMCLARYTTNGKTRSVCVPTAAEALLHHVLPHTWRNVWGWVATAAA